MTNYTVRIELHSSLYAPDFETLHREMRNEGFGRTITSGSGIIYHLPRGEYNRSTTEGRSEVLSAAERAVAATGKTAEVLVTESAGRVWSGLSEVK